MFDVGVRRSITGLAIFAFLLIAGGGTQAVSQEMETSDSVQAAQQRVDSGPIQLKQFRSAPRAKQSARSKAAKAAKSAKRSSPKKALAETAETQNAIGSPAVSPSVRTPSVKSSSALSPSVLAPIMAAPTIANAHAEMPLPAGVLDPAPTDKNDAFGRSEGNSAFDPAPSAPPATPQVMAVVEGDQLNEVDLAGDHSRPDATLASAALESVANDTSSAWNMSSTIGRVFIALGGLLTIVSAARLYFA